MTCLSFTRNIWQPSLGRKSSGDKSSRTALGKEEGVMGIKERWRPAKPCSIWAKMRRSETGGFCWRFESSGNEEDKLRAQEMAGTLPAGTGECFWVSRHGMLCSRMVTGQVLRWHLSLCTYTCRTLIWWPSGDNMEQEQQFSMKANGTLPTRMLMLLDLFQTTSFKNHFHLQSQVRGCSHSLHLYHLIPAVNQLL